MRSCSASGAEHAPGEPFTPGPTGSAWCRRTAVKERGLRARDRAAGARRLKLSASGPNGAPVRHGGAPATRYQAGLQSRACSTEAAWLWRETPS